MRAPDGCCWAEGHRQPCCFLMTHLRCQHLRACVRCHYAVPADLVRLRPSPAASGPLARCALRRQCPVAPLDPGRSRSLPQAHSSPRAARRPAAPSRGSHGGQVTPGVWDRSEEGHRDGPGGLQDGTGPPPEADVWTTQGEAAPLARTPIGPQLPSLKRHTSTPSCRPQHSQ